MDVLEKELIKLQKNTSFDQTIEDVDKIIQQLERARDAIDSGTYTPSPKEARRRRNIGT